MKEGRKTSEFWLTMLAQVAGIVVLFGVFTAEDAQTLVAAIEKLVAAATGLMVALAPLIAYIKSRADVKSAAEFSNDQ